MSNNGITKAGDDSLKEFCRITNFIPNKPNSPESDCYCGVIHVEIKKNTYNQVRPHRYNVLVGYHEDTNSWYVIPADDVVFLTKNKKSAKKSGDGQTEHRDSFHVTAKNQRESYSGRR
jgi:hypothetical protein